MLLLRSVYRVNSLCPNSNSWHSSSKHFHPLFCHTVFVFLFFLHHWLFYLVSWWYTFIFGPFHYLQSLYPVTYLQITCFRCPRLIFRPGLFPCVYVYVYTHNTHTLYISVYFSMWMSNGILNLTCPILNLWTSPSPHLQS